MSQLHRYRGATISALHCRQFVSLNIRKCLWSFPHYFCRAYKMPPPCIKAEISGGSIPPCNLVLINSITASFQPNPTAVVLKMPYTIVLSGRLFNFDSNTSYKFHEDVNNPFEFLLMGKRHKRLCISILKNERKVKPGSTQNLLNIPSLFLIMNTSRQITGGLSNE